MKDCKLVRSGEAFHGKQGLDYFSGISAETAGSTARCEGRMRQRYHIHPATASLVSSARTRAAIPGASSPQLASCRDREAA